MSRLARHGGNHSTIYRLQKRHLSISTCKKNCRMRYGTHNRPFIGQTVGRRLRDAILPLPSIFRQTRQLWEQYHRNRYRLWRRPTDMWMSIMHRPGRWPRLSLETCYSMLLKIIKVNIGIWMWWGCTGTCILPTKQRELMNSGCVETINVCKLCVDQYHNTTL